MKRVVDRDMARREEDHQGMVEVTLTHTSRAIAMVAIPAETGTVAHRGLIEMIEEGTGSGVHTIQAEDGVEARLITHRRTEFGTGTGISIDDSLGHSVWIMIALKEEESVLNMHRRRLTRGYSSILMMWGGGSLLVGSAGVWRRYDRLVVQQGEELVKGATVRGKSLLISNLRRLC